MKESDKLNMNELYEDGKEFVIEKTDKEDICRKREHYIGNPDELYAIGWNGQELCHKLSDLNYQISQRKAFFDKYLDLQE